MSTNTIWHNPENVPADKVLDGWRFCVQEEVDGRYKDKCRAWTGDRWTPERFMLDGSNSSWTYIIPNTIPLPGAPVADKDGWITWIDENDGKPPVDKDTLVDVKLRNGSVSLGKEARDHGNPSYQAGNCWNDTGHPYDIIAYRVVQPALPVESTAQTLPETNTMTIPPPPEGYQIYNGVNDSSWRESAIYFNPLRKPWVTPVCGTYLTGNITYAIPINPTIEPEQNNMNTNSLLASCGINPFSTTLNLPAIGSKWVTKNKDGSGNYTAVVIATGPDGIVLNNKKAKEHIVLTAEEWNARHKAQILTKRELRQQQRQNQPVKCDVVGYMNAPTKPRSIRRAIFTRLRWLTAGTTIGTLFGKTLMTKAIVVVPEVINWFSNLI